MNNLVYNPALHVECGYSSSNLQSKEKSYSKEPPYKCQFCGRGFLNSSNLKRHERIHTGERPYKCKYCDRGFIQSFSLKTHESTHTGERPYKCELCGRSFTQKPHLKAHKRTHTGERPYKCELCGRSFTQKPHLKAHKRTHTGERPFQGKYCGCSFIDSRSLKKHLRSLHSFAFSSSNQNSEHNTELLQNRGPVNVTSNVPDQHLNFVKILFEGNNINSHAVFYHSPQPSTSQGFELENRNYVSKDEIHNCRLCSYSFREENELNLHYITHFDNL